MSIKIVDSACVQVTGGFLKLPPVALDSKVSVLKRSCNRKMSFSEPVFCWGGLKGSLLVNLETPGGQYVDRNSRPL